MTKILRTIRFDSSDDNVFVTPAGPDEIALSGAFAFAGIGAEEIRGKTRQAFANGFLALPSLGRATFVSVGEADESEVSEAVEALARLFVEDYEAPDHTVACDAAREEIDFACELADGKPLNTLLTVHRTLTEEGAIHEEYREITPPGQERPHTRIWDIADE
ncbi:DUF6505 family protein [Anderseniella sp. Alg231-50]|uniref:DUF6505 family protein n=1 Tax=Anderseniella sp. Alg231-50 TaxID=1922226 RepID=UPI000D55C446